MPLDPYLETLIAHHPSLAARLRASAPPPPPAAPAHVSVTVQDLLARWPEPDRPLPRPAQAATVTADPPLPSLRRQIGGFLATAGRVVASGLERATPEEQAARLSVCRQGTGLSPDQTADGHCDRYRPSDGRCGSMQGCGCHLAAKVPWKAAQCPLGRWPV